MTLPWARNVFAVLILLIGSGTTVFGQEYDPTGQRSLNGQLLHSPDYLPFTHLTLELSISKKDCLQLEPILFTTTLRNQTKRSIVDHGGLSFDYGALEIYVQSPGKEQHQIPTLTRRKIDSMVSPWVMEPGALVPSTEMFFVGLDEIFPQPGLYHLWAVLYDLEGKRFIQSKPIPIHIQAPEGMDRLALEDIRAKHPEGSSYFWHPSHSRDTHQDFLLLFPDSTYAPYMALRHGAVHINRQNYRKALDYLNVALKHSSFVFADEVLENLRRAHRGLGHRAQAQHYVEQINTRFPNSKYADKE